MSHRRELRQQREARGGADACWLGQGREREPRGAVGAARHGGVHNHELPFAVGQVGQGAEPARAAQRGVREGGDDALANPDHLREGLQHELRLHVEESTPDSTDIWLSRGCAPPAKGRIGTTL